MICPILTWKDDQSTLRFLLALLEALYHIVLVPSHRRICRYGYCKLILEKLFLFLEMQDMRRTRSNVAVIEAPARKDHVWSSPSSNFRTIRKERTSPQDPLIY